MQEPFIAAQRKLPEITFPVILVSILLAIILAASNTYLALKIGILTSASIPAAVLSMGILRFVKGSNILQNNLVQTAASAGEAVAGGVVYTVPALIILHYWSGFPYFESLGIALLGGILGVLFSIPLRRTLVTDPQLRFPEGVAIAEVLIVGSEKNLGLRNMLLGGSLGGLLELAQTGLKAIGNTVSGWWSSGATVYGFGFGFSPALLGAGYLIGFSNGLSLLIGAVIAWGVLVPILTATVAPLTAGTQAGTWAMGLWDNYLCYIGIGAMITAGVWTLFNLVRPFIASLKITQRAFEDHSAPAVLPRTERDMPLSLVWLGVVFIAVLLLLLFAQQFSLPSLGLLAHWTWPFLAGCLLYVLFMGFLAVAICSYFSGMVGVTASPGSSIVIAGLLLGAFLLRTLLLLSGTPTAGQLLNAEAVTIIMGAVITGAACIANDNIQDLKVGHILGATPWKQQIMLLLGVVVAALVIPVVMELLFNVYGIANVFPHAGMDPAQVLPAPPAAAMAAITQGVFAHDLPWGMLGIGVGLSVLGIMASSFLAKRGKKFSVLTLAIGLYLPWSSSTALFLGALFALFAQKRLNKRNFSVEQTKLHQQRGILLACGLVAGAALMDVLVAIPMAFAHNSAILQFLPLAWHTPAQVLGVIATIAIGLWFYRSVGGTNGY